jgi:hypothetical protein
MKTVMKTSVHILLAALALGTAVASAQTLYKSTLPDGKIVYGDKPAPGAVKVEETKPDTTKGVGPGTAAKNPVSREAEALKRIEKERAQGPAATGGNVQAAEQALREAEAAKAAGAEPLPGERIGTAGGKSRLTEAYFERQKRLESAVDSARRNLDMARSGK